MNSAMDQKDIKIISALRANARVSLTKMSKRTNIPISTIHDRIKYYRDGVIKKYTSLLDFSVLGFHSRAHVMFKVKKECKEALLSFLSKHQNVNALFKINNGYDFLVEAIFRNIKDLEEFTELLEERFNVRDKQVYYLIEDIMIKI